jgi:hypothetical protein
VAATSARTRLEAHGLTADLHELTARASDQSAAWQFSVTMDGPVTTQRSDAMRTALAPADADVHWFTTSVEQMPTGDEDADAADDDEEPTSPGFCTVCGTAPAPWHHTVPAPPPGAGIAVAKHWFVCDTCHRLVAQHDTDALTDRLTAAGIPGEHASEIARALTSS